MSHFKALSASVVTLFTATWYLMLAVGIVHLHLIAAVRPLGYWQSLPIAFLFNAILDAASLRAYYDGRLLDRR